MSAQSPRQQELTEQHPEDKAVFVEGGFTVWLRHKSLTYFILKSEEIVNPLHPLEEQKNEEKNLLEEGLCMLITF